jgi:signal transduction histidine kinase
MTAPPEPSSGALRSAIGQPKTWLPLLIAFLISISALVLSEMSHYRLSENKTKLEQSVATMESLLGLEAAILNVENAQRGYLLTRKQEFLTPFEQSARQIRPFQQKLMELVAGSKEMRDGTIELNALIARKLAEMERTITPAKAGDFDAAILIVNGDEGRSLMQSIREQSSKLRIGIASQIAVLGNDWQSGTHDGRAGIAAVVGVNFVLLATLLLLRVRDFKKHQEKAGQLRNEVKARTVELTTLYEELASLSSHLQANSEKEKATLARDLHDELGGILTSAKMDLSWLQGRLAADPEAGARAERLDGLIDDGIALKRRVIENLRPSLIDHLGLSAAIKWYVEQSCAASGVQCNLDLCEFHRRLPADTSIALYRIVQESLTNALRHSKAKTIDIKLAKEGDGARLTVADDGVGIADAEKLKHLSHGLAGMRHRAQALGGTFDIQSALGQGTRISAFLPLDDDERSRPTWSRGT